MELEKKIIASFIIDIDAQEYIPVIEPEHFQHEINKNLIDVIKKLYVAGDAIDLITVQEKYKCGDYLYQIIQNDLVSSVNIGQYVKILKEKYVKRNIVKILSESINEINAGKDANSVIHDLFGALTKEETNTNIKPIKSAVKEHLEILEGRYAGRQDQLPYATGFVSLDEQVKIVKENLILLAARPSVGKSVFALNLVDHMAQQNKNVWVINLEMSESETIDRFIAKNTNITLNEITDNKMSQEKILKIFQYMKKLQNYPINFLTLSDITIEQIRFEAKRLHSAGKLDVLVLDYLQLIKYSLAGNFGPTHQISHISRQLKIMAKELQIPVIALSQLSREIEKRPDPKPKLSDLRDSGALEQDSNVVMFLSRDNDDKRSVKLNIEKNRNGPCPIEIDLMFMGEYQKFIEKKLDNLNHND